MERPPSSQKSWLCLPSIEVKLWPSSDEGSEANFQGRDTGTNKYHKRLGTWVCLSGAVCLHFKITIIFAGRTAHLLATGRESGKCQLQRAQTRQQPNSSSTQPRACSHRGQATLRGVILRTHPGRIRQRTQGSAADKGADSLGGAVRNRQSQPRPTSSWDTDPLPHSLLAPRGRHVLTWWLEDGWKDDGWTNAVPHTGRG